MKIKISILIIILVLAGCTSTNQHTPAVAPTGIKAESHGITFKDGYKL